MGRVNKTILPFILLILFNVYQINILLFSHVHYLNGIPVAHSHPNKGEHHHPEDGLRFIALLSSIHSLGSESTFNLSIVCSVISILDYSHKTPLIQDIHLRIPSLRAPPYIG